MGSPDAVNGAVPARAKVNLFLHVGDKRDDGFHPLQSLAVFTEAGDSLRVDQASGLTLDLDGPFAAGLQMEQDNLVLRAARALAQAANQPADARLALTKNLPVASGIGGGSADAAAALRGLSALWKLDWDQSRLREIGAALGSDIPVCVASLPSFMAGRGEILTPAESFPRLALLLVNPRVTVPTKDVFAALTQRSGVGSSLPNGPLRDYADLLRFLETTRNDLEAPARALQPVIGDVLSALAALPGALFTRMSGSGATCFAIFPDDDSCARAAPTLAAAHADWWIQPTAVPEFNIEHEDAGQDIGPSDEGI
jgi:4-diphosphocytidyl-2-C-methyl-D-erythritol kinase